VSAVQVFAAGYLFGAAVFGIALILMVLRLVTGSEPQSAVPFISGCVLMLGSKLALVIANRKAARG
jgi:hypothetical protein